MLLAGMSILAVLGLGISYLFPEAEDGFDEAHSDENTSQDTQGVIAGQEIIPLDVFIESVELGEDPLKSDDLELVTVMEQKNFGTDGSNVLNEVEKVSVGVSKGDGSGTETGGPGDVLIGDKETDRFEVSLGTSNTPQTTIENFLAGSLTPEDGSEEISGTQSRIWFKNADGKLLSRDELLIERFTVASDADGVAIAFENHQTVLIRGMTQDDFVENSRIIGNFSIVT